jgi:hypothetical protein
MSIGITAPDAALCPTTRTRHATTAKNKSRQCPTSMKATNKRSDTTMDNKYDVGDKITLQEILYYPQATVVAVEEDDGVAFYTLSIAYECYEQAMGDPES